ncbi:MAG: hypothetical protein ACC641_06130 [Acidiferrobacterales bacterium]
MKSRQLLFITLMMPLSMVTAGEAEVVKAEFTKQGATWHVSTTLRHGDTGWEHYADAWRVVDSMGRELGKRVLVHPHENEQPFTRSQGGISIPANITVVFVEAHDKKHGWNKERVRVDLNRSSGKRYRVSR